jgi:hypothetical protein
MCYSARIVDARHTIVRKTGASISLMEFAHLYGFRLLGRSVRIPKVLATAFVAATNPVEHAILADIDTFNAQQASDWEQALFKQRKRLADAQRALQTKTTKAPRCAFNQRLAS